MAMTTLPPLLTTHCAASRSCWGETGSIFSSGTSFAVIRLFAARLDLEFLRQQNEAIFLHSQLVLPGHNRNRERSFLSFTSDLDRSFVTQYFDLSIRFVDCHD